jgi:outer membrane protein
MQPIWVNADLKVKKNSYGPALQIGADFPISKSFFVNVDVKKIWMKTDVSRLPTVRKLAP